LAPARKLVAEGRYTEAEALIESTMLGRRTESYQPLGDLRIRLASTSHGENYRRELNLDQAIASIAYDMDGIKVVREVFSSRPDGLLAVNIRADGEEDSDVLPDITAELISPHPYIIESMNDTKLLMTGRAPSHVADNYMGDHPRAVLYEEGLGLSFAAVLEVSAEGGTLSVKEGQLVVTGAQSVTVYLPSATSFLAGAK